ncbi:putative endo-1,3(4)-beta-glucanase 2 [Hypsizygus marmoreus]|uniref:glucan endo-1,3-beta-D-glucosidase n=1 Tax=Hypsizygus marmoreus TaxID=39966 RepID=A0A369K2L9_HYPMA|nr:putative endo-1,3(4)-beta-glucanase 2 [Hypsizygus marmoreus]
MVWLRHSALAAFCSILTTRSVIGVVFGPIGTDRPTPAGGPVANDQPPNSFFQGFSPPFPTNDWWVGYGAGNGDAVVGGPFPYQSSLTATAIQFGISTKRDFDGTSIHQTPQTDWAAGFVEHNGDSRNHKALSWDTQSVTVQYFTGSSTLTSYLVPGSPYLAFSYAGATPRFTSAQGAITSFSGRALGTGSSATVSGTKFLVVNGAGTYVIYSLSGSITLTASNAGAIVAGGKFTGVLRLVKLNASGHEALLDQYYTNYPTGVATDYDISGDVGTLRFTWTVQGNANNLLMLTWPHHRLKMQNPNFPATSSLSYLTTKGYMYPAIGNIWNLRYNLPTITWNAPRTPDASCRSSLIAGLEYEISHLPAVAQPADFYFFGGHVAMVSRLALIAEQVGRTDLIQPVINYLKAMFGFLFNSASTAVPAYETSWGGIINRAGYNNVWVDYGNGYYNDHHFHYGYFLAAGAVIAKYDSGWLNTYRSTMNWFLRDIVNPSKSDPHFTVTRSRDWFAGHSWASGIASGAGPRDQESIGEAVNGYYGALLWAEVTGNTNIKAYSRLLIANEQHAAQVYWHLYPKASGTDRDQPYPEQGIRNLVTIGNVMDFQSGAWLFWGAQKVQIAAIQILPVTPINEYMYDATWAQAVYDYTQGELNDPSFGDEWKSVIYLAYSQANPAVAAQRSVSLTTWGSGNSYSNQMYFLSTRPGASGVCTAATGNPIGNFYIQSTNGNFISTATLPNLIASVTSQPQAAQFKFAFAPNAGTIQAMSNNKFVTADQAGTFTLSAARDVASAWEVFIIRPKSGAGSGIYSILAASNKNYLTLGTGGALINNGATEASSAGFRLVAV